MLETFKATVKKKSNGLEVEAGSRGFSITFDEPSELGGTNKGMNPVEGILCALGACEGVIAALFAKHYNFTYEEFYVELEGDLDFDGLKGVPDVPKGLQAIRFTMHFKTDESQERCEEFARLIESKCPVFDTLANGTKLECVGVIKD